MKIIVCVSLVPDSTTKVKIDASGKKIDDKEVSFIINPYDEFAVEEAVQLKEKNGGEVMVVSYGTEKSKEAIKKAFPIGCDKGVLIKSETEDFDAFAVAKNLADFISKQNPDIVFFGKQSIDFDGMQVPLMVAEITGIPCMSVVVKLDITDGKARAEREIEGGKEILEANLPVIVAAQKGLNNPRYPNLKSIMASKSKPIETINAVYSGNKVEISEMYLPSVKGKGKILENGVESVQELVKLLREEAKVI
jgi:electron transfer flavoprotein beta subunit